MKRSLLLVLTILLAIGVFIALKYQLNKDLSQPIHIPSPIPSVTPSPITVQNKTSLSLFVPYWALPDNKIETTGFDKIIYFGVRPDKQGISNTEQEVMQIKKFNDSLPENTQKLLALRMIDSQENFDILENIVLQQKIIDQTIQFAQKNNMRGVVLDLEISAIPFDSLVKQINKFTSLFYASTKKNNLTFAITFYGDSFYRARPFDVKILSQNADTIMIMAYDFSKAKGNPGPNFPLAGREKFGYDLNKMITDFLEFVPPQKITVIFGAFGYDWLVSQKDQAIKPAQALTLSQIKQKFIDQCEFANCQVSRDTLSAETQILYTDKEGQNHIVWFEDMESIKRKQEYLRQKGITSFSFWAYSYF